jgi:hypothetical protein
MRDTYLSEVDTARVEADEVELIVHDSRHSLRMAINELRTGTTWKGLLVRNALASLRAYTDQVRPGLGILNPA